MIVEYPVHFRRGARGRRRLQRGPKPAPVVVEPGHVPRISRLLALAIRFEELIRQGAVKDYAELARIGGVSRARISQIMDLLNLAPDLQDHLLHAPPTKNGRDPVTERQLRGVLREADWQKQRRQWNSRDLSAALSARLLRGCRSARQPGPERFRGLDSHPIAEK